MDNNRDSKCQDIHVSPNHEKSVVKPRRLPLTCDEKPHGHVTPCPLRPGVHIIQCPFVSPETAFAMRRPEDVVTAKKWTCDPEPHYHEIPCELPGQHWMPCPFFIRWGDIIPSTSLMTDTLPFPGLPNPLDFFVPFVRNVSRSLATMSIQDHERSSTSTVPEHQNSATTNQPSQCHPSEPPAAPPQHLHDASPPTGNERPREHTVCPLSPGIHIRSCPSTPCYQGHGPHGHMNIAPPNRKWCRPGPHYHAISCEIAGTHLMACPFSFFRYDPSTAGSFFLPIVAMPNPMPLLPPQIEQDPDSSNEISHTTS